MRLPRDTAAFQERVNFGTYVAARLTGAKLLELAGQVKVATAAVKAAGRAWEDAEEPVQEALAVRDSVDDALDEQAQTARGKLAGRGVGAVKEVPYTLVFPKGIDHYVAATIAETPTRYGELVKRMEDSLPETDEVRQSAVAAINAALPQFAAAKEEVDKQRTTLSIARTRLEAASDEWDVLMEKVYGALVSQFGRKKAERFFPRRRRSAGNTEDGPQE